MEELQPDDPPMVGPYRLAGRLGSGGMGRVFLGQSPGGRLVAVKVIRADLAADPGFRARFAREVAAARAVGGLFTAQVADADPDAPVPWLATAYVAGPSLAEAVAEHGPLPVTSVLALAAALAEGLGEIHAAGLVHRDLKPTNVLLAHDGPRVIDFGISRAAEATALTGTGMVVGSPGFMSPEQAEGGEAGPPSDIFSLGAVVTFAATGEGPFGTGSIPTLLYRTVHHPPDISSVPGQIRLLVGRCLAKDADQRPTTGQILGELGPPRPGTNWPPAPAAPAHPAYPVPDAARAGVAAAENAVVRPGTEIAAGAGGAPAAPADDSTVTGAAPPQLGPVPGIEAAPGPGHSRGSRPARRMGVIAAAGVALVAAVIIAIVFTLGKGPATATAGSPTAYVTNEGDGTVTPIDLATNTPGTTISVGNEPVGTAITRDGKTAYVADHGEGTVTPIDLATNTPGTPIMVGNGPVGIAITPDGKTAYVTDEGGSTVTPIDLATGTPGTPIRVGNEPQGIAITPDGKTAYVTNWGGSTVTPIDLATGTPGTPISVGNEPVGIAITPDGKTAYITDHGEGTVTPIDLATNTPGTPIMVGNGPVGIAITPDGKTAYVTDDGEGTVTPIDLATGTPATPISVGKLPLGIAITPDGKTAYIANYGDGTLTPIDLATNTPGTPIRVGNGPGLIAISG